MMTPVRNLIDVLYAHLYREDNIFEVDWRQKDLVIWDNFSIQHARPFVGRDDDVRTLRKVNAGGSSGVPKTTYNMDGQQVGTWADSPA